jgi:hypothetical protein
VALTRSFGEHALLPVLVCNERVRGTLAVSRWLSMAGVEGAVIGQWLGRAAPTSDTVDWLVVVLSSRGTDRPAGLRWLASERLGDARLLCAYQRWAIERANNANGMPTTTGPFGQVDWLHEVSSWVEEKTEAPVRGIVTYKATPSEAVLRFNTSQGEVFFKGLSLDRASEAHLTSALASICPESFAQTVALETRTDGTVWWLARACPGVSLAAVATPENVARVAAAYTGIQERITLSGLNAISSCCPVLDVEEATSCISELTGASDAAKDIRDRCCARLQSACEAVSSPRVRRRWIALDLAPGNILLDCDDVRFIDLDDSFIGPAPLALATLSRRLKTNLGLGSFDVIATALEAWLGWRKVAGMTARGEVEGVLDLARDRLTRSLLRELMSVN